MTAERYCTLVQLKDVIGLSDVADDLSLSAALSAVSDMVDDHCRRTFDAPQADVRRFTASSGQRVRIQDFVSVSEVEVHRDGTWHEVDGWLAEPLNPGRKPHTALFFADGVLPRQVGAVRVTAEYGWPEVPAQVQQAVLLQTSRLFKRGRDAPFGVLMQPEMESGVRLMNKLDVDVEVLLAPLRRIMADAP